MFGRIEKGITPKNAHVVFCPNKQHSFEPYDVFGSCFRMLAVNLVSDLCVKRNKLHENSVLFRSRCVQS